MLRRLAIAVFALLSVGVFCRAEAESRVALIIGNANYYRVGPLQNPVNDARDLAEAFTRLGFDTMLALDLTRAATQKTLAQFSAKAATSDIAVVYYAGHGAEAGGINYLIPVDAKLSRSEDLDFEAVALDGLIRAIDGAKRLRLIMLDAARDIPLKRGLVVRDEAGPDTLVVYSTRAGTVGSDGTGRNSPFASAILKNLAFPDVEISLFFRKVRDDVLRMTAGRQEPFTYGSVSAVEFYLNSTKQTVVRPRGRRVALVLGVDEYSSLSALDNPVRDAKAVAELLQRNGFEVYAHSNLPRSEMLDALEEFKEKAKGASTGLVYFAGHGMEVGSRNIIAPKDAQIACELRMVKRVVDLNFIFDAVSVAERRVVMLDACRNDPIPGCSRGSSGSGGFRGFSDIRMGGLLLANSTLAGALASDGDKGDHSPFAKSLIERLTDAPQSYFRDVLESVAEEVEKRTDHQQIPEIITRGATPRDCLTGIRCGESSEASAR